MFVLALAYWWWIRVVVILFCSAGLQLSKVLEADQYQGEALQGSLTHFDSQRVTLIDGLIKCLEQRFTDIDTGVLKAAKLADLSTWPPTYDDNQGVFL